jgi:hypothetical protein
LTALGSLWFTARQWRKINKKVAMIDDSGAAIEVLPTWYTGRMMSDYWEFALVTTSGKTICIRRIKAISNDGKWMDVELMEAEDIPEPLRESAVGAVAHDRTEASIQISEIVAAYELTTS